MKAALFSLGSKSSIMTLDAMKAHFDSVDNINLKDLEVTMGSKGLSILHRGKPIRNYDCVYAKGSFRYAPLLRSVSTAYFGKTYIPIKPNAFTLGHDKLLTQLALQQYQIPMPETYIVSSIESAKKILDDVHYPIIIKQPHGTQGKGVMFADSFAAASSMLDTFETLRNPFLIQEYIETEGTDVRVFVVGDKVVAAMKRKADGKEVRSNIHAGGSAEALVLDTHTKKIAIKAAKALGAEICGVDILESVKGPQVIEINLSPGLQGIMEATKVDIPIQIARYLAEKTKEFAHKDKEDAASKIMTEVGVQDSLAGEQQIISKIDFRSDRLLLPPIATKLSEFDEDDEFVIKARKGKISIEKY